MTRFMMEDSSILHYTDSDGECSYAKQSKTRWKENSRVSEIKPKN